MFGSDSATPSNLVRRLLDAFGEVHMLAVTARQVAFLDAFARGVFSVLLPLQELSVAMYETLWYYLSVLPGNWIWGVEEKKGKKKKEIGLKAKTE